MQIRFFIAPVVFAGGIFLPLHHAGAQLPTQSSLSPATTGQPFPQSVGTPQGVPENAQQGKALTEEEAAILVQSPDFNQVVTKNPKITKAIADHPYAAAQFYHTSFFATWAVLHPNEANGIQKAAEQWDEKSESAKEDFYKKHPTLKGGYQQSIQNPTTGQWGQEGGTGTPSGNPENGCRY